MRGWMWEWGRMRAEALQSCYYWCFVLKAALAYEVDGRVGALTTFTSRLSLCSSHSVATTHRFVKPQSVSINRENSTPNEIIIYLKARALRQLPTKAQ